MALNHQNEILKVITSKSSVFSLRKDGILTVEPLSHFKTLSYQILNLDHKIVSELTNHKKVLFLTDNRTTYGLNSEQRNHVKELLNSKALKCAVLLNNDLGKFFFNFFNHLYKLKIPVKAFTKKENAVSWLLDK